MATLGEFGSLLQLGFGIGVGLSVFQAPLEFRATRISSALKNQINIVSRLKTDRAKELRSELSEINLEFNIARERLDKLHFPAFTLAIFGSVVNLIFLILASLYADKKISINFQYFLIFISSIYYLLIVLILDRIVWFYLANLDKRIKCVEIER